jgi:hypothetical protein
MASPKDVQADDDLFDELKTTKFKHKDGFNVTLSRFRSDPAYSECVRHTHQSCRTVALGTAEGGDGRACQPRG